MLRVLFDELIELDRAAQRARLQTIGLEHADIAKELSELLDIDLNATHSMLQAIEEQAQRSIIQSNFPEIAGYKILEQLGEGGMGEVFLAERMRGPVVQRVAIKRIKRAIDPRIATSLQLEQRLLAEFEHPNIVRWLDAGVDQAGLAWFAMNYVHGQSVLSYVREKGCTMAQRLALFAAMCDAVAYAHARGVIHRDIKNSNVMVDAQGNVYLLDFGIARLSADAHEATNYSERMFSLASAAPEQILGKPTSVATDVYALGLLLYQMLTGDRPYDVESGSPSQIQERICVQSFQAPSARAPKQLKAQISQDLDRICLYALRKNPSERYRTVDALLTDLSALRQGRPVMAAGQNRWYLGRKFLSRHWQAFSVGFLVVLSLLALSISLLLKQNALLTARNKADSALSQANALNEFLLDAFRLAAPGNTDGKQLKLSEVIDQAQARLAFSDNYGANDSLRYMLGRVRINLGDLKGAQPLVDALLASKDQQSNCKGFDLQGSLQFQLGDVAAAKLSFERAYALAPDAEKVHLKLKVLQTLYAISATPELQLQVKALVAENPGLALEDAVRASYMLAERDAPAALQVLDQALASSAEGKANYSTIHAMVDRTRAMALRTIGRFPEALQALDRAIPYAIAVYGPDSQLAADCLETKAYLLFKLGRNEESYAMGLDAIARTERAKMPVSLGQKINLNSIGLRIPAKAAASKAALLQLIPGSKPYAQAAILTQLGINAIRQETPIEALHYLQRASTFLAIEHPLSKEIRYGISLICPNQFSLPQRAELDAAIAKLSLVEVKEWQELKVYAARNKLDTNICKKTH